jgi:hypothetical protein
MGQNTQNPHCLPFWVITRIRIHPITAFFSCTKPPILRVLAMSLQSQGFQRIPKPQGFLFLSNHLLSKYCIKIETLMFFLLKKGETLPAKNIFLYIIFLLISCIFFISNLLYNYYCLLGK